MMSMPHWYKKPLEKRYGCVRSARQILRDIYSETGTLGSLCPPDRIEELFPSQNKKVNRQ